MGFQPYRIPSSSFFFNKAVQLLSCVRLFATPWTAVLQAFLSFTISRSSLKLMSIELVDAIQPSHPLSSLFPIIPSIRVFSSESALCIRWPKYWSFSFSISPSSEYSGLISFGNDWFDLAVQQTLKSLLQHHHSKASVLWHSAFFTVQLSHPYKNTGKTITLTIRTFIGKVMPLLFNMLSRFSSKEQASFNFMAAVTIHSDIGVQEKKNLSLLSLFPHIFTIKLWD